MDKYNIKDFRHIGGYESTLIQKYKAATGSSKRDAMFDLFNYRGIYEKEADSGSKLAINSKKFDKYLHSIFRVVEVSGSLHFYNWSLHHYEEIPDYIYLRFFKEVLDSMCQSLWNASDEGVYHLLFKRNIKVSLKNADVPLDCINLKNGVYYLKTDAFVFGDDPDKFFTYCLDFDFEPLAKSASFEKFIIDILNGDMDSVISLQDSLGLSLDLEGHSQKIVYYGGSGSNGKSTLVNALVECLSIKNCATVSLKELLENDFIKSVLYQKMICVCNENVQDKAIDTSILKNISGADYVTINRKYKEPINAKIYAQIYVVSNDLLLDDRSRAMERRLLPFKFLNYYTVNPRPNTNERPIDFELQTRLKVEKQGIFNYILEGYKRVRDNNWKVFESDDVKAYREELLEDANPVRTFVNGCIVYAPSKRPKKKFVFNCFLTWCSKNGVNPGPCSSMRKFYQVFKESLKVKGMYYGECEVHGYSCYKDIDLVGFNGGVGGISGDLI